MCPNVPRVVVQCERAPEAVAQRVDWQFSITAKEVGIVVVHQSMQWSILEVIIRFLRSRLVVTLDLLQVGVLFKQFDLGVLLSLLLCL